MSRGLSSGHRAAAVTRLPGPAWWGKEGGKDLGVLPATPCPWGVRWDEENLEGRHINPPDPPHPRPPGFQQARPGLRLAWDALAWPLRAGAARHHPTPPVQPHRRDWLPGSDPEA